MKTRKPKILIFDIEQGYKLVVQGDTIAVLSYRQCKTGRYLNSYIHTSGYKAFKIANKHRFIHRLVAEAFMGPCPKDLVVNHKDGNKFNNTPENLEYVTINDNIQHSIKLGMHVSNDPKRSGRFKHGKATKDRLKEYKKEWYEQKKNKA